jgi:hypothetical protein
MLQVDSYVGLLSLFTVALSGLQYSASREVSKDTRHHPVGTRLSAPRNPGRAGDNFHSLNGLDHKDHQAPPQILDHHGDRTEAKAEGCAGARSCGRGRSAEGASWRRNQAWRGYANSTAFAGSHIFHVILLLVRMPETSSGSPLTCLESLQRSS